MNEVTGNIWDYKSKGLILIPTNGDVNRFGLAVMGRGLALQATRKFPGLQQALGDSLRIFGNQINIFDKYGILTFPVKHHWHESASLELIDRFAEKLSYERRQVFLPRVGCGNGGLDWKDVKPILEKYLTSDNFTIVNYEYSN